MAESKDRDNPSEKSSAPDESVENGDTPEIDAPDESSGYQAPEAETRGEDRSEEMQAVEDFDLNLLLDIPLEITVELGRAKVQIQELLELGPGSTVKLSKLEGEPVDILANNKLIARGEVVLQNKKYGIRITEITSRMNRIKTLS